MQSVPFKKAQYLGLADGNRQDRNTIRLPLVVAVLN